MQHFTSSDGTRIAYLDEGRGLPLLCLAGLTRTVRDFDYVAPHLDDVRLLRMDYRGRGQSGWSGGATYTVPREAKDAVELLEHLGIEKAAILGTSRGGLIGMFIAATAPERMIGLCLNDVGPHIERKGLEAIFEYVGRNPKTRTHAEHAELLAQALPGFANVPPERWLQDARRHFTETEDGLVINYDPALRESFIETFEGEDPDLWPLFDTLAGKPVALVRGANSDLLSSETAAEMRRRRPDMIFAEVPDRAHIPFLDEPEALAAIRSFLDLCR